MNQFLANNQIQDIFQLFSFEEQKVFLSRQQSVGRADYDLAVLERQQSRLV